MSLPTEILDKILSFLQSDVDTLNACSSASPILSQMVERHLYANATFHVHTPTSSTELCQLLQDRPYISNYIRNLEIKFNYMHFLEEMSFFLPTLSVLRRIRLVYAGPDDPLESFWRMPQKSHLAFSECLRLPSLTDICVENIPLPLSAFSNCNHLRNLSLRCWSRMEGNDNMRLPTVDCLTLHRCGPDYLSTIISSIRPLHLSALKITEFAPASFKVLQQILVSCSHSLTSLDIDIDMNYRNYYILGTPNPVPYHDTALIPISFSVLPHLLHLTIRTPVERAAHYLAKYARMPGFLSAIPAITKVLKTVSSLGRLTLDLSLNIKMERDGPYVGDILCSPLHSFLVQSAAAIDLVDLRINSMKGSDSPDTILALFTSHPDLMQFVEQGTLTLTPVVADML